MKKVEKILAVIILIAVGFRALLLHDSSIMLVLSLMILAFLYGYLGFILFNDIALRKIFKKESYQGIAPLHILGGVISGIALSMACIALLFKLQSYPGATFELELAIVLCSIVLIICLVKIRGKYSQYYKNIVSRLVIFICVCTILLVIPKKTYLEIMWRDNPGYINAVEKVWKDPGNKQLQDTVNQEQRKLKHH